MQIPHRWDKKSLQEHPRAKKSIQEHSICNYFGMTEWPNEVDVVAPPPLTMKKTVEELVRSSWMTSNERESEKINQNPR